MQLCVYSVHCRVTVDNKSEFYRSSSRMNCTVWCKTRELNAEETLEKFKKHVCQLTLIKQFTVSTCQAFVQTQPGPEKKTSVCSLCHHRFCGLKVIANFGVGQYSKFRVASCHCVALCPCCHDPFIVRSAQTCPPLNGFNQLAHSSRCSRSTLATVCFCVLIFFVLLPLWGSVFTLGL